MKSTSEQRILHVVVTKKWFDLLRSGYKKQEYRGLCPHWVSRLFNVPKIPISLSDTNANMIAVKLILGASFVDILLDFNACVKEFDIVRVTNGYSPTSPKLDIVFKGLTIGKPQQGLAPKESLDNNFFIINLGDIVSASNLTPC